MESLQIVILMVTLRPEKTQKCHLIHLAACKQDTSLLCADHLRGPAAGRRRGWARTGAPAGGWCPGPPSGWLAAASRCDFKVGKFGEAKNFSSQH